MSRTSADIDQRHRDLLSYLGKQDLIVSPETRLKVARSFGMSTEDWEEVINFLIGEDLACEMPERAKRIYRITSSGRRMLRSRFGKRKAWWQFW